MLPNRGFRNILEASFKTMTPFPTKDNLFLLFLLPNAHISQPSAFWETVGSTAGYF